MKKHFMSKILLSAAIIALGFIIGASVPMNTYVVNAASTTEYISEVKIGIGKNADAASKDLLSEGYTILKGSDGKYADLNEDADDANSSKKIVYLGYKTTTDVKYAVTDLAVMNMKGGYSIRDYEVLMENQLKTQVIPFVNRFIATLIEYRENLNSENPANKARAEYMRSMLNKLKDDDTEGLIGDLLVRETKYEMTDAVYNALSAAQKKQHADILTIIMQANGKNTLTMETLLTKASDSQETSWIDRIQHIDLDSLKSALPDTVDITEQDNELDKKYYDDACKILEKWDTFYEALMGYDDKANALANLDENEYADEIAAMAQFDENSSDKDKNGAAVSAQIDTKNAVTENTLDLELVSAYEHLSEIDYDSDGGTTLLDFFTQDYSDFDGDNIRNLYPLVASLSAGQIAGLDFLSLQDLVTIATADATSYNLDELGDVEPASIYEDVNREVFEKGKVALTNEALRAEAAKNNVVSEPFAFSTTNYILWGATAVATAGMIASWATFSHFNSAAKMLKNATSGIKQAEQMYSNFKTYVVQLKDSLVKEGYSRAAASRMINYQDDVKAAREIFNEKLENLVGKKYADKLYSEDIGETIKTVSTKSKIASYLGAAFTVAMAVLAAYSIYSTIKEMMDYYKVDYTPIPKYIVEEADITAYNSKGEKIFIGNNKTSAYYRAAECNRPSDDKNYEVLQNYADLNGDVGRQWLALYQVKFEGRSPIIADSLKVVTGTSSLPSGYTTGIHMFGTTAAFNLNNSYYVFNNKPMSIYVYFKTDDSVVVPSAASVAGSNFSVGSVFLYGGIGAAVGAAIAVVVMLAVSKKRESASVEAA